MLLILFKFFLSYNGMIARWNFWSKNQIQKIEGSFAPLILGYHGHY